MAAPPPSRRRIGSGPTFAVLACVLAGVGSSLPASGPSATDGSRSRGPSASAPIDGGSARDLTLPEMQGPGLDGAVGSSDAQVQTAAAGPAAATATVGTGNLNIPARMLSAYRAAAATTERTDPSCNIRWSLLASIGRIESGHARGGALTATGVTIRPILGPVLDGGPGLATIRDTDDGRYDGDKVWDRAVGPMQFIPTSWTLYSRDANGDGTADPHQVDDAVLASANYLCAGDRDLSDPTTLRRAVYGYNHSWDYVNTVLAWMTAYDEGRTVAGDGATVSAASSGTGSGSGSDVRAAPRRDGQTSAGSRPSSKPTARPRPSTTPKPTSSATPTSTPTTTPTVEPTTTPTVEPTPTPTPTVEPTTTPTPSVTPTPDPTPTPTSTECPAPTTTPTDGSTPTPTQTSDPCDGGAQGGDTGGEPQPSAGPTGTPTP